MARELRRYRPARPGEILARLLDEPAAVEAVRRLEPRLLTRLIRHIGLEDAGEFVALATPEQLGSVFDEDLWQSPIAGGDEQFDVRRFALWLEILVEGGAAFAAAKLLDIPEEALMLGLHRQVLVIDLDALAIEMSAGVTVSADRIEKALDGCAYIEIDQYRVIARSHDGWDALTSILLALDQDNHDALIGILERCCAASMSYVEDNGGLYEVLTSEQMLEVDAAAAREDRRAMQGFISPASARSFLALIDAASLEDLLGATAPDAITRAYFRDLAPATPAVAVSSPASPASPASADGGDRRLLDLLREAQVLDEPTTTRRLAAAMPNDETAPLRSALVGLASANPDLHAKRVAELVFLANVLCAGAALNARPYRPGEAAETVMHVASAGFLHLGGAPTIIEHHSAVKLFRIGWKLRTT